VGHFNSDIGMTTRSALVVRKQLSPLEEARAVQAMLEQGYTTDGAATVPGWARQRVSARAKILELPSAAQTLVGSGEIPLSAVETLLAIAGVSPPLVELVTEVIAEAAERGDALGAQLVRQPGWVIRQALQHRPGRVWADALSQVYGPQLAELKLGKKTDKLLAWAEALHTKLDRYAYGPPAIRFTDSDIDQARAAGVLLEVDPTPLVVDRAVFRELAKNAVARTVDELQARVATRAQDKSAGAQGQRQPGAHPARRARHRAPRPDARAHPRAHGVNLDLGAALMTSLASVDPADINVARFFCLCGRPYRANYADGATMPMPWSDVRADIDGGGFPCVLGGWESA
jgi:hypothetical protein